MELEDLIPDEPDEPRVHIVVKLVLGALAGYAAKELVTHLYDAIRESLDSEESEEDEPIEV